MPRPPFPRSLSEFQAWFGTDEACLRYLIDSRWPEGFRCPRCGHGEAYELATQALLQCRRCGYQASATAGTVLHATRLPVRQWFWAAYLVATYTPGISAVQLQRQLGITRYETAWAMLQKLRRAMVRPERDRITGMVEVDDAYVGGLEEGRRGGRQREGGKAIVVAAVEIRGRGLGRIRLSVVEDVSGESLGGFVEGAVEPGSVVFTDGWMGYVPLKKKGYDHRPKTQGAAENAAKLLSASTPGLLQPQDLAHGHPSRRGAQTPAPLPQRVHISVQPTAHPNGRIPDTARPRGSAHTHYLQHVVCW